jgi:regulator of extracellular matrix RemA (YlzA/DUF370 family)
MKKCEIRGAKMTIDRASRATLARLAKGKGPREVIVRGSWRIILSAADLEALLHRRAVFSVKPRRRKRK